VKDPTKQVRMDSGEWTDSAVKAYCSMISSGSFVNERPPPFSTTLVFLCSVGIDGPDKVAVAITCVLPLVVLRLGDQLMDQLHAQHFGSQRRCSDK
jgi:hypothetical protein